MPKKELETALENDSEVTPVTQTDSTVEQVLPETPIITGLTRSELIGNIELDLEELLAISTDSPTIVTVNRILELVKTL